MTTNNKFNKSLDKSLEAISEAEVPIFHTDDKFEDTECQCEMCPQKGEAAVAGEPCDCAAPFEPTIVGIVCSKHNDVPTAAEVGWHGRPKPPDPTFHADDEFKSELCECEKCDGGEPCNCEGDMIDSESIGILCQRHFDHWREGGYVSYDDPMAEGMAPMSHDNTLMRKMRKHKTPRSRRHMKGSDRYRLPDPAKKVKARLKRDSRHQNRPEVEEAVSFLKKYGGKPITESDLQGITDRNLFIQAIDFLTAMATGGWVKSENGITNGHFIIEDEAIDLKDGKLLWNKTPLKLDWNWLYSVRELLQKRVSNG